MSPSTVIVIDSMAFSYAGVDSPFKAWLLENKYLCRTYDCIGDAALELYRGGNIVAVITELCLKRARRDMPSEDTGIEVIDICRELNLPVFVYTFVDDPATIQTVRQMIGSRRIFFKPYPIKSLVYALDREIVSKLKE